MDGRSLLWNFADADADTDFDIADELEVVITTLVGDTYG